MAPVPGIKWSRDPKVRAEQAKHGPGWSPHRSAAAKRAVGPRTKTWMEMGPGELKHYATKTVQQATKTELEPFHRRSTELGAQEGAVAGRYGGYGKATDALLGGIQQGAEGSAKTFSNQVAENAQRASKEVETSGQNLTGMAGGMDPQLRNQLLAQQGNVAGIGAAAGAAAGAQGQNEANFMTNLRAAAAQKVTEGQGQIAGAFAKQKGEVGQKESELLGKRGGRINELFTDLSQKQFTNRATEAGLGIKQGTLRVGERNAGAKELAAKTGAEKLGLERNKFSTDSEYKQAKLQLDKLNGKSLRNYRNARADYTKATGGKADPKRESAYLSGVSRTEAVARSLIPGGGKVRKDRHLQEEIRKGLREKGANADQISAAMNLIVYGRLGPQDRKRAIENGVNPEKHPTWFS